MIIKFIIVLILIGLCLSVLTILGIYLWSEAKNAFYHQAPTLGTYSRHYDLMRQKLQIPDGSSVIDLGCGDGGVLRFFSQYYKCNHLHGIDNNLMAIYRGRFINQLFGYKDITLFYGDIQDINLSEYDYIYVFLLPKHIHALQSLLQDNIKSHGIIISNSFAFLDRPHEEIITDGKSILRLYKKLGQLSNKSPKM